MPFKRKLFFVLLMNLAFSKSIPSEDLDTVYTALNSAPGLHVNHNCFYRVKPVAASVHVLKCRNHEHAFSISLQEETL